MHEPVNWVRGAQGTHYDAGASRHETPSRESINAGASRRENVPAAIEVSCPKSGAQQISQAIEHHQEKKVIYIYGKPAKFLRLRG